MMKKERREVRLAGCGRTLPGTSLTCQTRRIRVWQVSGTCPWVPRDKAMGRAPLRTRESTTSSDRVPGPARYDNSLVEQIVFDTCI
ncbi:Uncharacterized protein TCM_002630 [Theobroma cacao]|uniref:Uncharacterized protein n=1 Tax=Theobroma cacao TaxID=3641 RepID=A0A061DM16_THECC|nr:Uncharacterized protein TCM_002630 [Theobroma cacao]